MMEKPADNVGRRLCNFIPKRMISVIVAVSENNAIGRSNGLLWHISEDLRYFKDTTLGHPVIMGRKTFDSIGKPLPGRKNIIISRSRIELPEVSPFKKDGTPSKTSVCLENDIDEVLEKCGKSEEEYFVIGGGSIYNRAFGSADRLYITRIHAVAADADTFFPEISPEDWSEVKRSDLRKDAENGLEFEFIVYE